MILWLFQKRKWRNILFKLLENEHNIYWDWLWTMRVNRVEIGKLLWQQVSLSKIMMLIQILCYFILPSLFVHQLNDNIINEWKNAVKWRIKLWVVCRQFLISWPFGQSELRQISWSLLLSPLMYKSVNGSNANLLVICLYVFSS